MSPLQTLQTVNKNSQSTEKQNVCSALKDNNDNRKLKKCNREKIKDMVPINRNGTDDTQEIKHPLNRSESEYCTGISVGSSRKKKIPRKSCNPKYYFSYPTEFFKMDLLKYFWTNKMPREHVLYFLNLDKLSPQNILCSVKWTTYFQVLSLLSFMVNILLSLVQYSKKTEHLIFRLLFTNVFLALMAQN